VKYFISTNPYFQHRYMNQPEIVI